MTRRLLLVEPSATMRHVLEKHARALGHEVEATESYVAALATLQRQYQAFGSDIAGVLYGWPSLPDERATTLATALESDDFSDLPVVVMSTDMRAETRAWAAGRERTAVLAWKDYLGVDALLERLLEVTADAPDEPVARLDNTDIHLLVVDDSLTIRYSLRDLFELQGYRVSLAADRDEAVSLARATRVDIAVLDFYLEETTGDALCRELVSDPACGDVACAILTGTYADHVIKRSLRAGAVECMFKNESSELLLTRVGAMARSVRQRRELAVGLGRLERVIDTLGGAVLVVDADAHVRHASTTALAELGLSGPDSVLGHSAHALLGVDELPDVDSSPVPTTWRDATGHSLEVRVTRRALPGSDESVLRFERLESERGALEPETDELAARGRVRPGGSVPESVEPDDDRAALLARHGLPASASPFMVQFERHVSAVGTRPDRVSLLVLGVYERVDEGVHRPVGDTLAERVKAGLEQLYRREHHVAALGEHRFGLLIRHADAPQSYLLTRRLMQLCDEMLIPDGGPALACTGCLVALANHPGRSAEVLLEYALRGLRIVDGRGVDLALLLDLKRMLAVYPRASDGTPPTLDDAKPDGTTMAGPGAEHLPPR